MILSPRIDDLSFTFAALESFINCKNKNNINVMCIFNSEEIGSMTKEGADSSFLLDILKLMMITLTLLESVVLGVLINKFNGVLLSIGLNIVFC